MKQVNTEIDGKKYVVLVPDYAEEWEYDRGIVLGPPDLEALNLPFDVEIRLHNELFVRGLITKRDVSRHRGEVINALQAALGITANRVFDQYK